MTAFLSILLLLSIPLIASAQSVPLRICTYNINDYGADVPTQRDSAIASTLGVIQPDVVIVQGLGCAEAESRFDTAVIKQTFNFEHGEFVDGPDADNGLYFDARKLRCVSHLSYSGGPRKVDEWEMHTATGDTIHILAVNFSDGGDDYARRHREIEATSIRMRLLSLPPGHHVILAGSLNIESPAEAAYQILAGWLTRGLLVDPIASPNDWNDDTTLVGEFTYPTRAEADDSGRVLHRRFDFILFSESLMQYYEAGSYTTFGNPSGSIATQVIDGRLQTASLHLPVYADLQFDSMTSGVSSNTLRRLRLDLK